MAKKLYWCIALIILVGLTSCSKDEVETPTVAQWNTITLAEDVFKSQYIRLSSSAPIRDSYEQRKRYARTLLERNIVANYAKQFGYDTIKAIQQSIQRTKELAAMKYFIREQVEPRLSETTMKRFMMLSYVKILRLNLNRFTRQPSIKSNNIPNNYLVTLLNFNRWHSNP